MSVKNPPWEFTNELYIAVSAYAAYIMVGINRSYSVFLIRQLRFPTSIIPISEEAQYWIENMNIYIMPIGCLLGGIIADTFGRKVFLILTYVPFASGWFIISFCKNIATLYFGIVLNAISSGMAFCTVVYIAEICSHDCRGLLLTLKEPAFATGVIICNILLERINWQLSAHYFSGLAMLFLILQFFLPESPTWLINNKNVRRATTILSSIRYSKTEAEKEVLDINSHYTDAPLINPFTKKCKSLLHCWRPFSIMFGLLLLQQCSGVNILTGCTVIFLDELRIPYYQYLTYIYSTVGFVVSFIPFSFAFYFGRKSCIGISGFGMSIATAAMAMYETKFYEPDYKPHFWIILSSVYVYYMFASIGVMIYPVIMAAEIFPFQVAALACGVYGCVTYIVVIVVQYLYFHFIVQFELATVLWFITICSFLNVPYAAHILPETHDKTLHQIQSQYFNKFRR